MLAGGGEQALVQATGVVQGGGGGEGCQDEYFQAVNIVLNIFIMGNVGVYSTCRPWRPCLEDSDMQDSRYRE